MKCTRPFDQLFVLLLSNIWYCHNLASRLLGNYCLHPSKLHEIMNDINCVVEYYY